MDPKNLKELLYQALETEKGGVQVYTTALRCVVNEGLREEWEKYLEQTRHHVEVVTGLMAEFKLDPEKMTPGSKIVKMKGQGLVKAMETALSGGDKAAAELVAAECVVEAEIKDHQNWELLGAAAKALTGEAARALKAAVEEVEEEEDEHLYHTQGWARELWIRFLGLPAVLPPPEEVKEVETEIGAARAKQQRGRMLRRGHPASRGRKAAKAA